MISKTFIAATLVAGLASGGAMAAPKKNRAADERAATRALNEQQLASAGAYAAAPAPMTPPMAMPAPSAVPAEAPPSVNAPAPMTAPTPEPVVPPMEGPSRPPQ